MKVRHRRTGGYFSCVQDMRASNGCVCPITYRD